MPSKRALVFANGPLPDPEIIKHAILPSDTLIAADGGTHHILSLGFVPSVTIGDLDSLVEDVREKIKSAGTSLVPYPRDKNETDLELALDYALQHDFNPIVILAALGGRQDHALANLTLLTNPAFNALDIRIEDGTQELFFTRRKATIRGMPGDLVSLLPWGGDVKGVKTTGLKWSLQNETLSSCKTRGVSNEMLEHEAGVEIGSGLLLIVHQHHSIY